MEQQLPLFYCGFLDKMITENDIEIENSLSPWVQIKNKPVGIWWFDLQEMHFDHCIPTIYGVSNEPIPCKRDEIKKVILERFNQIVKA